MDLHRVCVGVDGSPASRSALEWAAGQAAAQQAELVVTHVYDWRVVGARAQIGGPVADAAASAATALVEAAVGQARAVAPEVNVRGEAMLGAPGPVLVAASKTCDLMVVGNRGRGGFASLLLGSVSQHVATHAAGPVVVVRGRPGATVGPIVVGVDGSAASGDAVRMAFEEAVMRDAGVLAVRVYVPRYAGFGVDMSVPVEDPVQRREAELRHLDDDIAAWREKFPDVPVRSVVLDGHTAEVLVGLSASARLIVVGTRGHGGFAGLLLGSVGLQLLHHADCPVLVARASDRA